MSEQTKLVNNIQFFVKNEVVGWLFNKYESREDAAIRFNRGDDFSYDVIDQPFHISIKNEEGAVSILLHIRSEYGSYSEDTANLSITFYTNGDKPKVTNRGGLGGDVSSTIMHFLKAGVQLREYVLDNNLMEQFAALNLETEGVLIKLQDDELIFERVAGKKRPSMACTVLFGGVQMKRPYQDEIMNSWMGELMSFEEKLEAAEDGDEDAMGEVAIAYLNGDEDEDIEPDAEKAVYWFRKQAEMDNPTGCFNLAIQYLKGEGTEQSFEQALYWMEKAAENGDDDAPAHVQTYSRIIDLQKKAEAGDAKAMGELAEEYMKIGGNIGDDCEDIFYRMSIDMASKAESLGEPSAQWILALAYEHGRGVNSDMKKAIDHFTRGAELGNASCQQALGCCYINGEGVTENKEKGFALCMKAAEQGNGLAMKNVGMCYQFGHGVNESMKKAIYWYEKALEVIDDPELAQKVMIFKTMPDIDEEDAGWEPPAGYMDALDSFMEDDEEEPCNIVFAGKIFVLTGLDTRVENQITEIIISRGGIIKSSTVLNTDYLIYDERYGTDTKKHERAVELIGKGKNIQMITAKQFLHSCE